jgi:Sulfotransferase domain
MGDSDMQTLLNKIRTRICSRFFIDYNPDYRSSVFLAGKGRSGSTWISDIINYRNEYRCMFEPFHPYKVNICKEFRYRQYLRPENRDKYFLETADLILTGKIKNKWVDSQNKRLFSNKRLIKDIRANLMLKWIHTNFPSIPIILLFRHPCAVAYSRIKKNWDIDLELYLTQKDLMEDHLIPFTTEIEKLHDVFEKEIFSWCIEYYVPLRQFKREEIYLAFYEKFCEDPNREADRMFSYLGKKSDNVSLVDLRHPSATIRADSAIISGDSLTDGWRRYVTKRQVQRAIEILTLFGLDNIYTDESIPHIECTDDFYLGV